MRDARKKNEAARRSRREADLSKQETALLESGDPRSSRERTQQDRFATGSYIGKYCVQEVLGRGGQARAYLAFDPDLERHVVIKFYFDATDSAVREEVLKEGRALACVHSPYVAQCYGAEKHHGMPYLVLEYVPGMSLSEWLDLTTRLRIGQVIDMMSRVAMGLSAVHSVGMLHRDIKPSNIVLGDDGIPRLVDFGLAESFTAEGLEKISGTFAYMAPEQAAGDKTRISTASDVFGLGAVFYELLTGTPPYVEPKKKGGKNLLQQARRGRVTPPRKLDRRIPKPLQDLCMRCLARDPSRRIQTAAEFYKELRRVRQELLERRRRVRRKSAPHRESGATPNSSGGPQSGVSFSIGKRRWRLQIG